MLRNHYTGLQMASEKPFNTESVSSLIAGLSRGKVAGLNAITSEHLQNVHPILSVNLTKLFNWKLLTHQVPTGLGVSYTLPLPKIKYCRPKARTCKDFHSKAVS